jgi:hypothetical protein
MSIKRIVLCPYSHSDWAWICTREWHAKRYIRAFEIALDLMDAGTGFTWFIDSWWEQFGPIRDNRPDLVDRMKPHVASGAFGLGPGAFTNPSIDACTKEVLIRNMLYGQRSFRSLFPDARFDLMSHIDCCGWFGQVPQLARKMGFAAMGVDRPAGVLSAKRIPRQFMWRGLDGSEIPTSRSQTYALFTHSPYESDSIRNYFTENIAEAEELGASEELMLFFGWDDDCLPLGEPIWESTLFEQIAEWNASETAQARLGTPDEFARNLATAGESLPLVEGVMDPAAGPRVTENGHDNLIEMRPRAAEALAQLEREAMHHADIFPQAQMDALWADVLKLYPHATAWLWEVDHGPLMHAIRTAQADIRAMQQRLRHDVIRRIAPTQPGRPIVVFNPLPFDRDESMEFFFALDEAGPTGYRLVDSAGNALPIQFVGDSYRGLGHGEDAQAMRAEWRIRAVVPVPACGFATVYLQTDNDATPATLFTRKPETLTTGQWTVDITDGKIGSVAHSTLGEMLRGVDLLFIETTDSEVNAAANRRANLIGLAGEDTESPNETSGDFENNGEIVATHSFEVADWSLIEAGPLGARLYFTGTLAGNPTELEVFIDARTGRWDCKVRSYVTNTATGYMLAQVTPAFDGTPHADVPFGVESRDMTDEPFPAASERGKLKPFWGHSWASVSDGDRGVAFLSTPGLFGYRLADGVFQHILLKTIGPGYQAGTRWGNRNRTGLGCQEMQFAILPHAGDWKASRMYREVELYRQPLDGADVLFPIAGDGPDTQRGLAVGPENVMLSAYYQDRGQTFLRVYDSAGEPTRATLELPFTLTGAAICNMLGEPMDDDRKLTITDNTLSFNLGAWEIATLEIDKEDTDACR